MRSADAGSPLDAPGDARYPAVDVVTVNYNGRRYLPPFLDSVLAIDYPPSRFGVVLVDNASSDGSVALVRERFPRVRVVEAGANLGFAGGCNLGIRSTAGAYVALVNNDTIVGRDWLRPLVETAESDPRIGLVGSKLLFLTPFLDLRLDVLVQGAGEAGARTPALALRAARAEGCEYDKLLFRDGHLGSTEADGHAVHLLARSSRLAVPVARADAPAALVLDLAAASRGPATVAVRLGDAEIARLAVTAAPQAFRCEAPAALVARAARDVINNAGTRVDAEGRFGDRGIFQFDEGQFDASEDVPALCGASVLLRRRMLEEIGGFDTRYFMYFEDVDLSWRAPRAGWRVVYTPRSSLRHVHAGTSREGSPLWVFFVTRNRLFFLVKHGTARAAVREVLRFYARAGHRAARWLLRRGAAAPATELQVARSLTRHLPGLLVSRYRGGMDARWTAVTPSAPASP